MGNRICDTNLVQDSVTILMFTRNTVHTKVYNTESKMSTIKQQVWCGAFVLWNIQNLMSFVGKCKNS